MEETTVLTVALDPGSQARFEGLRRAHYPPELNRIPAHVSLFHQLPATEDVQSVLAAAGGGTGPFTIQVIRVQSLGRGVAYRIASSELHLLHERLAESFGTYLIAQDRQPYRPHVVVQNKVTAERARALEQQLTAEFTPWDARAIGLDWWDYLGGPWRLRERFAFAAA